MNLEKALVFELKQISGLENRIFPLYAMEGIEPPFVIYVSSEGEETKTLEGYNRTVEAICEIHILGNTYSEMKAFARQVIDKVTSFYGRAIGQEGLFIPSVSYEQPAEVHEKERNYYRTSFDLRIWYRRET